MSVAAQYSAGNTSTLRTLSSVEVARSTVRNGFNRPWRTSASRSTSAREFLVPSIQRLYVGVSPVFSLATQATPTTYLAFTLADLKDYRAAAIEADTVMHIRSKTLGPHHPSFGAAAKFAAVMWAKSGDRIAARDRHRMAAVRGVFWMHLELGAGVLQSRRRPQVQRKAPSRAPSRSCARRCYFYDAQEGAEAQSQRARDSLWLIVLRRHDDAQCRFFSALCEPCRTPVRSPRPLASSTSCSSLAAHPTRPATSR